jgi:cysteine-S-conjugate beta-lyase
LALRGITTLAVRLEHVERSALEIARWLANRPEVQTVLHPAMESCPGHDLWKRDFAGSSGLFSQVIKPEFSGVQVRAFVDALELFKLGYSWGGVASLALAYDMSQVRSRTDFGDRLVRLSIGLESTTDLIADLERGLQAMQR